MGGGRSCAKCDHHPIRDKIGGVFRRIFGGSSSGTSRRVSREDSYDPDKAMMEETIRIQQELTEFLKKCEGQSDVLERDVLEDARESIDSMMKFLESINEKKYAGQKLNLNLKKIERENNRLIDDTVHGFIKKKIQKRVSLDDSGCLSVLKMSPGSEKEKAMSDFLNEVLKSALDGLVKEIKKSLNKQMESVQEQIEDKITLYTNLSNDKLTSFKEIEKIKNSDEEELEKKVVELAYKQSLCYVGIEEIDR